MKKTELLEQYWEEFLQDCHYELVVHAADDSISREKAEPTENNFWAWYMKHKMVKDNQRINEHLDNR
jgi:hypothetical protein